MFAEDGRCTMADVADDVSILAITPTSAHAAVGREQRQATRGRTIPPCGLQLQWRISHVRLLRDWQQQCFAENRPCLYRNTANRRGSVFSLSGIDSEVGR